MQAHLVLKKIVTYPYSKKAEQYERYRWHYHPRAIERIREITGIDKESTVADIGAGTGRLATRLAKIAGQVYAIEPDPAMSRYIEEHVSSDQCTVINARAEGIPLPNQSVNLITVAQAIHWFEPEPARGEFLRVIKPGGWLAILNNQGTDTVLNRALSQILTPEYGVIFTTPEVTTTRKPFSYFFGHNDFQEYTFPFDFEQDWEAFFGALCSASYTPGEESPCFGKFKRAAWGIFEGLSQAGKITIHAKTQLAIGRLRE